MFIKDRNSLITINEAIDKILEFSSEFDNPDHFYSDDRSFDAVMMNFIVIGEMISRISDGFKEKYPDIEWFKIKGFRNLVAHNYFGIDAEEIWQIISSDIPLLKNQVEDILKKI